MNWKYFVGWILMAVIANLNGALREFFIKKFVNEIHSHQISTITLSIFYGTYVWFVLEYLTLPSSLDALILGILWLILTLLFEFGVGHYVFGSPWSKLFSDYKISTGKVWPFFLIWVVIAPYLIYYLQKAK